MLNKPNPLRYMTNGGKNQKSNFCSILTPVVRAWAFNSRVKDTPLQHFFWLVFICLTPFFFGIVWIDKLHDCQELVSVTTFEMETEKGAFTVTIAMVAKRKNVSSKA